MTQTALFVFFISTFILKSPVYALELQCAQKITVKIPTGPKTERQEIANTCYHLKKQTFMSENCKNRKCLAYTENKIVDVAWSTAGTPGSRLCYKLGGTAQIVNLIIDKKEFKTDRCYFDKDQSFVDIGTFEEYNRELENKLREQLQ